MTIEKKTIRSDIPGSHVFLNGSIGYIGTATDDQRRLVVPRNVTLNGNISACNTLVVEGVIETENFSAARLDILEPGLFNGTAEVRDCVIAGCFEGKLVVHGLLTVKSTGRILGNVEYGALEAESGARIEGKMIPVTAASETQESALELSLPPTAQKLTKEDTAPHNVKALFTPEESDDNAGRPAIYRRAARG